MMGKRHNKVNFLYILITILLVSPISYGIKVDNNKKISQFILSDSNELDLNYIYQLTENLSNIVFTEYNEELGEIAKGRAFGTKGEHKAAEILFENMSELGLKTELEPVNNRLNLPAVASKIEVLEYGLSLKNGESCETVDCFPAYSIIGLRSNPFNLNCNFSYTNLKIQRTHPKPSENFNDDYVLLPQTDKNYLRFINTIKNDVTRYYLKVYWTSFQDLVDFIIHPHCKAKLYFDDNNFTHNIPSDQKFIPRFFVNGSVGKKINSSINDYLVDFYMKQQYNKSVASYNVVGELEGIDPTKTVIIGCLYDGWWNQATADSAIGISIVMAIAKYFCENKITPKYTIKFIGFCGEEYGMRGSKYYDSLHRTDNIIYMIDLNQLGFKQINPRLTLEIAANDMDFLNEIWDIVQTSDYVNRTGNIYDILPRYMPTGHLSDDHIFAKNRKGQCKTVCFLKNGQWLLHHRDGLNHSEGDVLKYYDPTDVKVTGEIILNVTKFLTI